MPGPTWRDEKERLITESCYKTFGPQQWFRGAQIYPDHPVKLGLTLEIAVNYRPVLMMKELLSFADKYGMMLFIKEVDNQGNPTS